MKSLLKHIMAGIELLQVGDVWSYHYGDVKFMYMGIEDGCYIQKQIGGTIFDGTVCRDRTLRYRSQVIVHELADIK